MWRATHRSLLTKFSHASPNALRSPSRSLSVAEVKSDDLGSASHPLSDSFGRGHDYLRISLTEKCNLRCFYCMPETGIELSPKSHLLSDDEVIRLATLFVRHGVTKIRLTGGEPTVRKGLGDIIGRLGELRPHGLRSIAMTSNGLALHRHLPTFVQQGLTHLNLSLDTLDPMKFELITRRRGHEAVLRSLDAALSLYPALQSVKVNVVVVKNINDSEIMDFVDLTRDSAISVRFIEYMPFSSTTWNKDKIIPSATLLSDIAQKYPDIQPVKNEPNDTARSFLILGHKGRVGFISSMSDHFCASCNRLRITADGQLKVCLFDPKELSLRDAMRSGASDEDLMTLIRRGVLGKKEKHAGMDGIDIAANRPMILIGGSPPRRLSHRSSRSPRSRPTHTSLRMHHSSSHLTHIDGSGKPKMVDVSSKLPSHRKATATGRITLNDLAFRLLNSDASDNPALNKAKAKGNVLSVAQIAGIMAAKKTSSLIPLCHPLDLSNISVTLLPETHSLSVHCEASVECIGRTGVEMEALTAVSVSLLTIWDMVKSVAGQEMIISDIIVSQKTGGASGDFARDHAKK